MRDDIKSMWVDALLSGEYKQGRGTLRAGNEFCALGVLCDLAVKAGVVKEKMFESVYAYGEAESMRVAPKEVVEWAELPSPNPSVRSYLSEYWESIAHLNDVDELTFPEIAVVIKDSGFSND